jgi:hypothetical protein
MRKIAFLLIFGNFIFGAISLHAQIMNGSFIDGLTGWTSLGSPQIGADNLPPTGSDALISSTDAGGSPGSPQPDSPASDTASDIESILGITSLPAADFDYPPTDGQALYQTFALKTSSTLTFSYSFATNDESPFDSVGYVLNGVYTQIRETGPTDPTPTAYTPYLAAINLDPGTYTLGFVAFNTDDNNGDTSLYVTDVSLEAIPEPGTWMLMACGIGALVLGRRALRVVA